MPNLILSTANRSDTKHFPDEGELYFEGVYPN